MNESLMNPDEYFLLTAAREYSVLMRWLNAPRREEGFNLPDPPDLWGAKLVETLMGLFERGDIVAQNKKDLERPGEIFTPTREQVEAALAGRLTFDYLLTAQGGARWEIAAEADWDKYLLDLMSTKPAELEVTATTREAVERYMLPDTRWNPFPDEHDAPVPGTIRWKILRPWRATYWRTLPIGYQMTCSVHTAKLAVPESCKEVVGQIQDWIARRLRSWDGS
jgi:hypothetical protein